MSDKSIPVPEDEKKVYQLKNVKVDTIGFVSRGANRKEFFLTKSDDEEDNMEEQDVQTPNVDAPAVSEDTIREISKEVAATETESLWNRFVKALSGDTEDDTDDDAQDDTPAVVVIPEELQKKLDLVDELVASQKELEQKLEKAEAELANANTAVEEKVFLAKADKYTSVGADRQELAGFMQYLNKNDAEKLEWFENLMKGVDAQLADAGIFSEFGKQAQVDQDDDPIQALIKSGEAESIEEAYLKFGENASAANAYLNARRKEVKTG